MNHGNLQKPKPKDDIQSQLLPLRQSHRPKHHHGAQYQREIRQNVDDRIRKPHGLLRQARRRHGPVPKAAHRHAAKDTREDKPETVGGDEGEQDVEEPSQSRRAEDADIEAEDGDFGECVAGYVGEDADEEGLGRSELGWMRASGRKRTRRFYE